MATFTAIRNKTQNARALRGVIEYVVSAPFQNVDFRRNGMSFFAGQHTGVIQPYTPHHLLA